MNGRELALSLIEEGLLSADVIVAACIRYMTDDEVQHMLELNELLPTIEEDEEE